MSIPATHEIGSYHYAIYHAYVIFESINGAWFRVRNRHGRFIHVLANFPAGRAVFVNPEHFVIFGIAPFRCIGINGDVQRTIS